MKNTTKTLASIVLALAMLLSFAGCNKSTESRSQRADSHNSNDTKVESEPYETFAGVQGSSSNRGDSYLEVEGESFYNGFNDYSTEDIATDSDISNYSTDNVNVTYNNRMLVRRVTMTVKTLDFENVYTSVRAQVVALGGYIEWSEMSGTGEDRNLRRTTLVIRVPSEYLDTLIESFGNDCIVTNQSESTEDVTLSYSDITSHIEALRIEQSTLMTLLESTTDLSDILTLQNRLSDLSYEIESFESQARILQNQSSFGTLTLTINEYVEEEEEVTPTPTPEPEDPTFKEEVQDGFKSTLSNLNNAFKEFIILCAIALPYLVILAIFVLIVVVIVKVSIRNHRKSKTKKAKKNAATPTNEATASETNESEVKEEIKE